MTTPPTLAIDGAPCHGFREKTLCEADSDLAATHRRADHPETADYHRPRRGLGRCRQGLEWLANIDRYSLATDGNLVNTDRQTQ